MKSLDDESESLGEHAYLVEKFETSISIVMCLELFDTAEIVDNFDMRTNCT